MSIQSFFKPKGGLPDPKGSLSSRLPSQAIALAIKEVATSEKGKKCSQYTWITDQQSSKWVEVAWVWQAYSILLNRRRFLSRVQKITQKVFVAYPLLQILFHLKFLTLYQPVMHICVMSSHKPIRIYMGGLILGVNTLYRVFCFFKLFPVVSKGLK